MVSLLFSLAFSYFEISRCIVPRKWREVKENTPVCGLECLSRGYGECLDIILSPTPSTVPTLVGAQNMFEELFSNFRWPSKEACRAYTRPQAGPRLEITFILRASAQGFLGSCSPRILPLLLPSVAFERTSTLRDSLLYPTSESLTDNGQERRPTIKL